MYDQSLIFIFLITKFSRSPDSACLENRPSIGGVVSPGGDSNTTSSLLLPGMEYTPTEQCQLQNGNESTHCTGMQVSYWARNKLLLSALPGPYIYIC